MIGKCRMLGRTVKLPEKHLDTFCKIQLYIHTGAGLNTGVMTHTNILYFFKAI